MNDFKNAKTIMSGGKKKEADFPGALVVNKAKHVASALNVKFDGTCTFDIAAQQIAGAKNP